MGGGSSTTTVRKRDPESAELKNMQTGIYNMLAPIIGAPTTYQQTLNDAVSAGTLPTANTKIYQDGRGYYYNTGNADRDVMNGKNGSLDGNQGYYTEEAWYRPEDNGIRQVWHPLVSLDDASYGRGGRKYLSKAEGAKLYEAQNQTANNDWSNSYFGRSWNDLRDRIDHANNAYDAALNAAPGLQGNVLNTADRISALSDTAQAALQPNINNINKLSGKLGDLGDTIAGATANYQTQSNNLNKKIEGVGDRQGDLASTVWDFTETGAIPEEMRRNLMSTVNSELNQNTGSTLNDLASRGVMNSSVANRSINNLSNAAADAYAKNYLDAYNAVLGSYGQANNTLASQADTYSKAHSNANQAWNDRLNGYQLAGAQYNNAIGGYNTANQNISQGYSNRLNGLNSALNGYQQAYNNNASQMQNMAAMPQTLAKSAFAQYEPVYNYWQGLRKSYDSKEDYDTVVKQGK